LTTDTVSTKMYVHNLPFFDW